MGPAHTKLPSLNTCRFSRYMAVFSECWLASVPSRRAGADESGCLVYMGDTQTAWALAWRSITEASHASGRPRLSTGLS